MKNLVSYFASRHLVVNVLFFGFILFAVLSWKNIGKEEMPEFESNWVRVTTIYPGATAEDVEVNVTRPIEDELKSVIGIEEVVSTSSTGSSSIRLTLDDDYPDKDEVMGEIKDAVLRVDLPSEVREIPNIRQFKSSEKAILDIGFYMKGKKTLSTKDREALQAMVLSFENQITSLPEISSIDRSYYLKPELQVVVDPQKSLELDIPLTLIRRQIVNNNVRFPVGSMNDKEESKVSLVNEYEDVDSFSSLVVRGNYDGAAVKLSELASVRKGFEKNTSIFKISGHEGVFINVKKSISTDILSAHQTVKKFIETFKKNNEGSGIGITMMDDESFDVRNRLGIVSSNAIIGFILIVLVLLVFLDFKSSFWVAMGIPFCAAFTLIIASALGYTVNNMTLAGIIIVLGIVVDDAIIIAENIISHKEEGMPLMKAAVVGANEVAKPIIASIVTTCVAFVPLIFFEGFFGKLVAYIPLIVILMLFGSLFESLFMLPAHMGTDKGFLDRFTRKEGEKNWFHKYELKYERALLKVLKYQNVVLFIMFSLLASSIYIFQTKMKFVMFPREESKEVVVKVKAKEGTLRYETSKLIQPLEDMFHNDTENIVGVRATVAESRRGGGIRENEASILVELVPADDRETPLNKLIERWEEKAKSFAGLESVKFLKGRWGRSSGTPIEIRIQENNNDKREEISLKIKSALEGLGYIKDVEIDKPLEKDEYIFSLKQEELIRFNVEPSQIGLALRSFVEGSILYSINKGDEEVDVRLTVEDSYKDDIEKIKKLKIENGQGQFIKITDLVDIRKQRKNISIIRSDFKRSLMMYASINEDSKVTPLQVARTLEDEYFPNILKDYPTAILQFKGEIEDSRESQGEFKQSVYIVIIGIYLILVVMFNSLFKPFLVLTAVPFGLAGVIFTLYFHGMTIYGFFAAIGALGMIGVVVNDSIVMVDKFESIEKVKGNLSEIYSNISKVAASRLRPIILTTLTTVIGVLPTAYGVAGYDSILAEMMLTMGWGLLLSTAVTLIIIPILYSKLAKYE